MNTGTINPNRLLRLNPSVYDQFAPASDHVDTVKLVRRHIEAHLGPIEHIIREKVQGETQIDIQIVAPASNRNHVTLITSGMSDQPMTTPINLHQYRFAELYINLPPSWRFDSMTNTWPIDLLLRLAQLPHTTVSWLGYGHSITFDNLAPCSNPTAPAPPRPSRPNGVGATIRYCSASPCPCVHNIARSVSPSSPCTDPTTT